MSTAAGPPGASGDPSGAEPQDVVHGSDSGTGPAFSWSPQDSQAQPPKIPVREHGPAAGDDDAAARRRSTMVKLGITAAVVGAGALVVGAIVADDDEPEYQGVCVDQTTQQRIDDDYCNNGGHYHGHSFVGWYFFSMGHSAPRIGAPVSGGSYQVPDRTYVRGGVPREGGSISSATTKSGSKTTVRGGFGSSSKGSGG